MNEPKTLTERQIKAIGAYAIALGCGNRDIEDVVNLAITGLRSLSPPEDAEEWIPVSERLPELHQHCLLWLEGADLPCIGTLNRRHARTIGMEHYFALGNAAGDRMLEEVIAWQPLPQPPEGKR